MQQSHLPDIQTRFLNVIDGLRLTCFQPDPTNTEHRVLFFGGSTVFCGEVADCSTLPSQLQRHLRQRFPSWSVENWGEPGATLSNRLSWLDAAAPESTDVVVFWFGVNDCGWKHHQRRYPSPAPIRLLRAIYTGLQVALGPKTIRGSNKSIWRRILLAVFREFVTRIYAPALASTALREHDACLNRLARRAEPNQTFHLILQPSRAGSSLDADVRELRRHSAVSLYEALAARFYRDVRHTHRSPRRPAITFWDLSNEGSRSPAFFFDDCHLTARGNELVAHRLLDHLAAVTNEPPRIAGPADD